MNKYTVTDEEAEILDRIGDISTYNKDPHKYDEFDADFLRLLCRLKDRTNNMFYKRYIAAREVIDKIAASVGIDPDDTSFDLYRLDCDDETPIAKRIDEWVSRRGEKARLKKRVQELEKENDILRTLIQK